MDDQVDGYGTVAAGRRTVELTDFSDVTTLWRCPNTSVNIPGPGEEHFHAGTLTRIDGDEHTARRKALGALLAARGHAAFREKWLFPIADRAVQDLLALRVAGEAPPEIELVSWARRINQQLAAAVAGYDAGTTSSGADRLFDLLQIMIKGRPNSLKVLEGGFDKDDPDFIAGMKAVREIVEVFHKPALDRRMVLAEQASAGEIAQEDLPVDFLMLAAQKVDPAWNDPGLVERDALLLMGAAVHTTSNSLVWVLQEILLWLQQHPDDAGRIKDEKFVLHAAQESLRLHPVVAGFARQATEDIALPHGGVIEKGVVGMMRSGPASADTEVFGETAGDFDPDRPTSKRISRTGLAFGMGKHMCFGMPLVMGTNGLDGSLVYLLKLLLDAGVQPGNNPEFDIAASRGKFVHGRTAYNVVLTGSSEPSQSVS